MSSLAQFIGTIGDLALVIFGFGLIIFVHELGHFVAARWAGIRVLAFALGFGPALVSYRKGFGLRRGSSEAEYLKMLQAKDDGATTGDHTTHHPVSPTEYRLNYLPLGGYVKMLGQDDMNPGAVSAAQDSYQNCTPWKRMVVISAGVVMNLIIAAALFIFVFMVGLKTEPAIVGATMPGSAAGQAIATNAVELGAEPTLQSGDTLVAVNGRKPNSFNDLVLASAMSKRDHAVYLSVKRDGVDGSLTFEIVPRESEVTGLLELGIAPPSSTHVVDSPDIDRGIWTRQTRLLGFEGLPPGAELIRIGDDTEVVYANELDAAFRASGGAPITLGFADDPGGLETHPFTIDPVAQLEKARVTIDKTSVTTIDHLLGFTPVMGVGAVEADSGGEAIGLRPGDVFARVGSIEYPNIADGIREVRAHAGRDIELVVLRKQDGGSTERIELSAPVGGDGMIGFGVGHAGESGTLLALPPRLVIDSSGAPIGARWAAGGGLSRPGTRVNAVDGVTTRTFTELREALRAATADAYETGEPSATVTLTIELPIGQPPIQDELELTFSRDEMDRLHALGWASPVPLALFDLEETTLKAAGPIAAIKMGVNETNRVMMTTYLTIARLFDGTVKVEHLKGPVGIAHIGTRVADRGFIWLLFFMALISVNLAVINFLPLPIVDGGQFLFLVYEQVRGRPVPVAFQNAVTFVGLVAIAAIFLIVTFHDVRNLFGG